MDDTQDQTIIDAEVIEEPATPVTVSDDNATVLLSLEEMIKNTIAGIEKATQELRQQRQMFADNFQNDPTYREHEQKVKEVTKVKQATKQEIVKRPAVAQIGEKIKTLSAELREKKAGLSDYLLEYQRMTGANEIEGPQGELLQIVNDAKIVKQPTR